MKGEYSHMKTPESKDLDSMLRVVSGMLDTAASSVTVSNRFLNELNDAVILQREQTLKEIHLKTEEIKNQFKKDATLTDLESEELIHELLKSRQYLNTAIESLEQLTTNVNKLFEDATTKNRDLNIAKDKSNELVYKLLREDSLSDSHKTEIAKLLEEQQLKQFTVQDLLNQISLIVTKVSKFDTSYHTALKQFNHDFVGQDDELEIKGTLDFDEWIRLMTNSQRALAGSDLMLQLHKKVLSEVIEYGE